MITKLKKAFHLYSGPDRQGGFTLIELMVALALAGLVMAGISATYYMQTRSYVTQNEVTDTVQSARAAIYFLERELRMAGADPSEKADSGILLASSDEIRFTMDITGGQWDGEDNDFDGTKDEADEERDRHDGGFGEQGEQEAEQGGDIGEGSGGDGLVGIGRWSMQVEADREQAEERAQDILKSGGPGDGLHLEGMQGEHGRAQRGGFQVSPRDEAVDEEKDEDGRSEVN